MSLYTMRELLEDAEKHQYALGSFNVSDLSQVWAVLAAAEEENSPVIIQAIAGLSAYGTDDAWWAPLRSILANDAKVPVALHLDHGLTEADCFRAMDAGFTSVMIDASRDPVTGRPNDMEANIATTQRVVAAARKRGITVEGEIGTIGGGGEGDSLRPADDIEYTDPAQAEDFVHRTEVDALAIGAGTSHGSVKFPPGHQPALATALIAEIHRRVPETFLVLHGSSSIGAADVDKINAFGGVLDPSTGIPDAEKAAAVAAGVRKINQGTDSHLAWTAAMREYLAQHPGVVDPGIYLVPGVTAMRELARIRMRVFGSAGRGN